MNQAPFRMARWLWRSLVIFLLSVTTSIGAEPTHLTVFAAASLTQAFEEIAGDFEKAHPGTKVDLHFAGSQRLRMQLEQGAVADVFASANMQQMQAVMDDDLILDGRVHPFIGNRLVVILAPGNPGALKSCEDLARPDLRLLLAAEEVPVGRYARASIEKMGQRIRGDFASRVLANVVSNENNVKHVVAKVLLGEADAGIVYESDLKAATELESISIPERLNVPARYEIAVPTSSRHVETAKAFIAYVMGKEGQATLSSWGFSALQMLDLDEGR